MSTPYEEASEASEILVENVLITIHEWDCEDCGVKHRLLGCCVAFSDGMEAYGFCEEKDVFSFISELVEAHGAHYDTAETGE